MNYFDLHCDTLYKCLVQNKSLISNDCELSFDKAAFFDNWVQCLAVWIPDEVRGERAVKTVEDCVALLSKEIKKSNSVNHIQTVNEITAPYNVMLTLEGGACLGGKIENVERFRKLGARVMTLTWNGRCELGDGALVEKSDGLSEFGKNVVTEMEKCGIVVDVSHASDKLFYDVASIAKRPIIATHSNSRSVCPHERNLTDEQFQIIRNSGGVVGINFHKHFLSADNPSIKDIVKHTEYFLSLKGEDCVAVGSDFDGGELPSDITGVRDTAEIYDTFLQLNYSETLVDKLFFRNAYNFFQNFDN